MDSALFMNEFVPRVAKNLRKAGLPRKALVSGGFSIRAAELQHRLLI
jgi:hypothetical protein